MNFCKQCGKELSEGAKFCGSCGEQTVVEKQYVAPSAKEALVQARPAKNPRMRLNAIRISLALVIVAVLCGGGYAVLTKMKQQKLTATGWKLVKTISEDGSEDVIDDEKGILMFLPDGRIAIGGPEFGEQNRGKGVYTSDKYAVKGSNRLMLSPPEGDVTDKYLIKNGKFLLIGPSKGKATEFTFTINDKGELILGLDNSNNESDHHGHIVFAPTPFIPIEERVYKLTVVNDLSDKVVEASSSYKKRAACMSNMKQIALGVFMFTQDYDEILQLSASSYVDQLQPYLKSRKIFQCPADEGEEVSYSFNAHLENVADSSIKDPANTVLFYEGKNGTLDYRHKVDNKEYADIAFVDGHIKSITRDEADSLQWYP